MQKTKEPQYSICLEVKEKHGTTSLGLMSNQVWYDDPKRMAFVLSRYKFVAKMLGGFEKVLEVGCADGCGSRIVRQQVSELDALGFDPVFILNAKEHNIHRKWQINFYVHDILESSTLNRYNAVYSLDVLEHIPSEKEDIYFENICQIGSPTVSSCRFRNGSSF